MALTAFLVLLAAGSGPGACTATVVRPSNDERTADARLVTLLARHATRPAGIGAVMLLRDVRVVRATLAGGVSAAFVLRGLPATSLAGVWFDGQGTRRQAYVWARLRVGLSREAALCFARRSVVPR